MLNYFLKKALYGLLLRPLSWGARALWRLVPRSWVEAMQVAGLYLVGYTLAILPFRFLCGICRFVGLAYYRFVPKRRHLLLSNWHHAFPESTPGWLKERAQRSCMHMVELGLMGFLWPFWRKQTLKKRFTLTQRGRELFEEMVDNARPRIILVPHFSMTESLTLVPWLFDPKRFPKMGVLYRPLDQPVLDTLIKRTRERAGLKLLPRSQSGLKEAIRFVKSGHTLVVLFDQSPREQGWLGTFMGRLATTTPLPGKLLEQHQAQAYVCFPRYRQPFSAEIDLERLQANDASQLIQSANQWLEGTLRADPIQAQTWLWLHDRWRFLDEPEACLGLPDLPSLPLPEGLKSFRLWIILPEEAQERKALRPTLEALRTCRPDVDLRLYLIEGQSLEWKAPWRVFPQKASSQKHFFKNLSLSYPDVLLVCTPPGPLDKHLALTQAPLRLGYRLTRPERKALTHTWKAPKALSPQQPKFWKALHEAFQPEYD